MNYPEEVYDVVRQAAEANLPDIEAAKGQAERAIRALPIFNDLIDALVRQAIGELVHAQRHVYNVRLRKQAGGYDVQARVRPGESAAVNEAYENVYGYTIGQSALGLLTGKELPVIAASERAIASGHVFNATLCEKLRPLVGDDQRVQDALTAKRLWKIFKEVQRSIGGEAAA